MVDKYCNDVIMLTYDERQTEFTFSNQQYKGLGEIYATLTSVLTVFSILVQSLVEVK